MRKDYQPISQEYIALNETAMVEQHWEAIWAHQSATVSLRALRRREEYRIMLPYLRQLGPHARVLDAGCGMGEWTIQLSRDGFDVCGIDLARTTIAALNRRFPQQQFFCMDIRHTTFAAESFDAVFSWGAVEHFETGPGACLAEVARVLKPGGYAFITVPFQNLRHIVNDLQPLARWDRAYNPIHGYVAPQRFYQWRFTAPELERELALQGLRTIEVFPIHLRSGLERTLEHIFHIPAGTRLNRIVSRMLSWIAPPNWFAHMMMAITRKAESVY